MWVARNLPFDLLDLQLVVGVELLDSLRQITKIQPELRELDVEYVGSLPLQNGHPRRTVTAGVRSSGLALSEGG